VLEYVSPDRSPRAPRRDGVVVAFSESLVGVTNVPGAATSTAACAVDCGTDVTEAYVVLAEGPDYRIGLVRVAGVLEGADLTRTVRAVPAGAPIEAVPGADRVLTRDDLAQWNALGLAITSADLVGVMRGVLDATVAYAADRRQYGVPIGSFQAVAHLLAEAHTLMEGSHSVALHASWAADNLVPLEALSAGRIAKAYCARAARTVCETAIQVHGGIGNTWECMAHVYLRRALLSTQWFGDDGEHLRALARERLGSE